MSMQESELAVRARTEPDAFAELMRLYEVKLLRYLRRSFGVSDEDGEDILQNSFIKAYQHLNDYDPLLPFSSWMYRITRNEAIDLLRKRKVSMVPLESEDEDAGNIADMLQSDADTEREVGQVLERERILSAMSKLKERHRTALVLRYLEEKEYSEISDIMQVPMGTVATLIARAKKELRDVIEKP